MKNMKLILILMTIFPFLTPNARGEEDHNQRPPSLYETQVRNLLNSLKDVTGVPAFSFAAVHKGKLVASVAVGYADKEKRQAATPQHLFRLASVSKIVGATMLADLVQEGRLDPDAALGSFYPELNEKYHQITVRQLLAHTSGMPHYQAIDYDIYSKHYTSAMEAVGTLKGRSLNSRPGSEYHYSSHGFTLAGAIYEKITGHALSVSLPEYIKNMTGKNSPLIEDITQRNPIRSKLYSRAGSVMKPEDFGEKSYSVFGAGLSARAQDLAFFGAKVLEKSRKSKGLSDLLFTPVKTTNGGQTGNGSYQVGFGWRVGKDDQGRTVYHHAGATPGARSVIVLYPDEELSFTFLSNASWISQIDRTAIALADLYLTQGKPKQLQEQINFTGSYGNDFLQGQINCQNQTCFLNDHQSPLSKWLKRFNPTRQEITAWPVYPYSFHEGNRLLMVTKVGFINLLSTEVKGEFNAIIGKDRLISLQLNP